MIKKLISGGQTGADIAALGVALWFGLPKSIKKIKRTNEDFRAKRQKAKSSLVVFGQSALTRSL